MASKLPLTSKPFGELEEIYELKKYIIIFLCLYNYSNFEKKSIKMIHKRGKSNNIKSKGSIKNISDGEKDKKYFNGVNEKTNIYNYIGIFSQANLHKEKL